jgi:hypothetical protein
MATPGTLKYERTKTFALNEITLEYIAFWLSLSIANLKEATSKRL